MVGYFEGKGREENVVERSLLKADWKRSGYSGLLIGEPFYRVPDRSLVKLHPELYERPLGGEIRP